MKKIILLFLLVISIMKVSAQCRLDTNDWKIIFQEEFNGTKSDLLTNWYDAEYFGTNPVTGLPEFNRALETCYPNERYCFSTEDQIHLSNGLGVFSVKKMPSPFPCKDKMATHEVGTICAKYDEFPTESPTGFSDRNGFVFGMFEIRCKLTKKGHTYNNFWLAGIAWPPEIDVFEHHGDVDSFFSTVHWQFPGLPRKSCGGHYKNTSIDIRDDFHVWTMVWTPKTITMFLDGVEYFSFDDISKIPASGGYDEMWHKMHLMLGNVNYCGKPWSDEGVYDDYLVDYVRVRKPKPYRNFDPILDTKSSFFAEQEFLYNTTPFKTEEAWVHEIIKPDAYYPNYDVHSGLIGLQGGGKFKYRGNYDLLWYTYWDGFAFKNFPVDWVHTVDDNIVVAEDLATEYTFYRKGSNILYEDGTAHTFHLIPTVLNAASDIVCSNNGDFLCYRNTAGYLNCLTRSPSWTWSAPTAISAPTFLGTVIPNTVAYNQSTGRIYYISSTNKIIECNSSGLISLPGLVTDAASNLIVSNNGERLFYVNTSGIVKTIVNTGGIWSAASNFMVNDGASSYALSGIKGRSLQLSPDPLNLQLYFVDYSNSPRCIYYDNDYFVYRMSPTMTPNVFVKSDFKQIILGLSPATKTMISFTGYDNLIHKLYWSSSCGRPVTCDTIDHLYLLKKGAANEITFNNTTKKSSIDDLVLIPNPSNGVFNIYRVIGADVKDITIFSSDGRIVFTQKISKNDQEDKIKIDIQGLSSGVYWCRISSSDRSKTIKILKNE